MNDLVPPVTRRAAYEMEWEEKPAADEGFEVIEDILNACAYESKKIWAGG